jgi:Flp pilus assembly pilin Flp
MGRNMLAGLRDDEAGSTTVKDGVIAVLTSILVVTVLSATGHSPASAIAAAISECVNALGG